MRAWRLSLAALCLLAGAGPGLMSADPPAAPPGDVPRVLVHQWGPERARPGLLRDRLAELEKALPGVDGCFLYLDDSSFAVMSGKKLDERRLKEELAPVAGLKADRLRHHLALVYNDRPADLFDDWAVPVANWEAFAKGCREAGLAGIAFDSEEYSGEWADYPTTCKYKDKSLADYRRQAARRGAEVMAAIQRGFPGAVIITLHGPTLSAANGPDLVYALPDRNELWGPFFAGMLSARRGKAKLCDGGELYTLRSAADFETAYRWQKWGIASAEADTPFIPASLRKAWAEVSVSWGVYDSPTEWIKRGMDPPTLAAALAEAVSRCDDYVWVYFERQNVLTGDPKGWREAVAEGKKAGLAAREKNRAALRAK